MDCNNVTDKKRRYSIHELAEKWQCSESNITHYIEDGQLPFYAKSLLLTLMPLPGDDDQSIMEVSFLKTNSEITKKHYNLMHDYNKKHWGDNPLLPKPAVITLGQDYLLDDEDIATASLENFSQCFTYQEHVEEFETKKGIAAADDVAGSQGDTESANENTAKIRTGIYGVRDEKAFKLVKISPELLAMPPKDIKKILKAHKEFIPGYDDWWRGNPVFPQGKRGRPSKTATK